MKSVPEVEPAKNFGYDIYARMKRHVIDLLVEILKIRDEYGLPRIDRETENILEDSMEWSLWGGIHACEWLKEEIEKKKEEMLACRD